jgi:hypothetical protein
MNLATSVGAAKRELLFYQGTLTEGEGSGQLTCLY